MTTLHEFKPLVFKATKLELCQCWASRLTLKERVAQVDGRPAMGPEITGGKMALGGTKNPSTFQHLVETLTPPRDGKDVASSKSGNDWYGGSIYWQMICQETGLQRNETSCRSRPNSTSTAGWKVSVGRGHLKY